MAEEALPMSSPSEQGVDAAGILAFLDAVDAIEAVELHSLMVLRHGTVVAQGWWSPYTPERPHLLYSLSKSFTSTALAFAVDEGLVGLDDTVVSHLPELAAAVTDERVRRMKVRHLAAMASGHTTDTWDTAMGADWAEPIRGFLAIPPEEEPGTVFAYNQSCTYTLGAIIQRRCGQTLTDYLRPRLLDPLGISDVGWQQLPAGRDVGFTGLHATTEAVARLGQLYLQRGRWQGRQLLAPEWVSEATRSHVSNAGGENADWSQGYGFQFWMSRHGYRGDGAYGQFCLVLPEQDAVVAITAATEDMQGVLDAVWEHLLPALSADGRTTASAENELSERLSRLSLPGAPARSTVGSTSSLGDSWEKETFRPAGGRCDDQPGLTGISFSRVQALEKGIGTSTGTETGTETGTDIGIRAATDTEVETETRDAADSGGWDLSLHQDDECLTVRLLGLDWAIGHGTAAEDDVRVPMATSAALLDEETLCVDVIFLETPHRLRIVCSLTALTFDARWNAGPLRGGVLSELRSPRPTRPLSSTSVAGGR